MARMPKAYYRNRKHGITLYHGDSLEILPNLEPSSIDAVITDPPYQIGAVSVGNSKSKSGTWQDMMNSSYWFSEWVGSCLQLLRPTGYLAVCLNWRTLPTLLRAFADNQAPAHSCLVWDKLWIGPSSSRQLRPRYEMVLIHGRPKAEILDRSVPDIFAHKWQASHGSETDHPAEKPRALMSHLVRHLTPKTGVVADPFAGSGTTALSAIQCGREFVGIESDESWLDGSVERIENEIAAPVAA